MQRKVLYFETIAPGKFKQVKEFSEKQQNHAPKSSESNIILDRLRSEWQKRNIPTNEIEKLAAITETFKQPEVKEKLLEIYERVKVFLTSDSVKGVLKKMTSSNFNDLLKKLTESEETNKLMNQVMTDPTLSKEAMELMKNVLNDEEKFNNLSDMMSSMMNNNNKE
ncbi:hypothetical protein BN1058_02244 [Paraliobacillus sp. PM-2]|uniref:hypothetical protein n=1 Tax=Paraliobacillus sp. PM-2 TaxID=1462524 RepID=UPI00061BC024|nr:hypothetical protein [Paraliobacillus sp. PM-2]CQR47910.1 hypothetical protein BN1058_02244 [Paraliobacillus sp. PM-2]